MTHCLNTLTLQKNKAVSESNDLFKQNWLFPRNEDTAPLSSEFDRSFEVALLKPNSLPKFY